MSDLSTFGPGPDWRCHIGRHDWSEFGDCRRCRKVHASTLDWWLTRRDYESSPGAKVDRARREARHRLGRAIQTEAAKYGHELSLELCEDAALNGWSDDLLAIVKERAHPAEPEAFAIAEARLADRVTFGEAERDEYGMLRRKRLEIWREADGRMVGRASWDYPR